MTDSTYDIPEGYMYAHVTLLNTSTNKEYILSTSKRDVQELPPGSYQIIRSDTNHPELYKFVGTFTILVPELKGTKDAAVIVEETVMSRYTPFKPLKFNYLVIGTKSSTVPTKTAFTYNYTPILKKK